MSGDREPWTAVDPAVDAPTWASIVESLRKQKLLADSGRDVTDEGRRVIDDLVFKHMGTSPDLSPAGSLLPFRVHVAPLTSGSQVIEDENIWAFVSQAMRKTLALEMEGTALGELAHR